MFAGSHKTGLKRTHYVEEITEESCSKNIKVFSFGKNSNRLKRGMTEMRLKATRKTFKSSKIKCVNSKRKAVI